MRRSAETINIEVSNITGRRFGRFRVKFSELAGATWLGVLLLGLLVVMGGALVAAGPGPALSNLSPTQGAHVPTATKVSFTADDPDQINASSAQIAVNGTSIPATVKFREIGHYETRIDPYWGTEYQVWVVDGYDYTSAAIESNAITNPPDVNSVRVSIADGLGNISTAQWTFYSSTPPNIANQTPANGATISTTLPTISAQITDGDGSVDPSSVRMIVDGTPVGVSCNTSYNTTMASYTPPTPLSPGTHTVNLTAKDAVGNAATSAWSFTVPAGSASFSSPAPASGSTVTIPNPTISVLVSSAAGLGGGATMLINGSSVPAVYTSFTPTSGKISYTPASLPDGVTTISV
ncbi:MAG: Ig-like domain-containing protein, partial [Actinobacteria bacterium]|nr:Ig-like domain-containing protein [Actinomycetota bacterium]